ncbi:MAG: molybdopterin-dependent oxidoreductase [Chloroflexi bacterium]|nr:molybdopterin-dependent oxidoreductase [Chloroflexota bacterium]
MAKTVTLTINKVKVTVPEGTLVVDAARKAGIDIPVFCYHPKMEPVGMCRQCLVEIGRPMFDRGTGQPMLESDGSPKMQFMPKLETACTNPVSEGMVVLTETEKAKTGQKEILELLLTNHPLDCPICDKGGECPLQNLTMEHGAAASRFVFEEKQRQNKHVPLGDLIFLDRERCVQCARCIRFQDKIAGEPVLGFYSRGRATDIVTFSEPGFDSVFSGNTTDICPVGALTTADFRFGARPWELKNAASICSQCPVGCNVTFNVRREVKSGGGYVIKRVLPRQNEQVNEIWLCDKGRFASYHYAESGSRLSTEASEYEANISRAAEQLRVAGSTSDAVILAGGRLANEDLFNLKQLATGLGAKIYFYTGMGGGEYTSAYGMSSGSNLGDLGPSDTILVMASDLYNEAPLWHLRVKAAAQRGVTVIVAAAHATKLDRFATFVVRYAFGDEIETVNGLAQKDVIGKTITEAANLVVFFGSDGLGMQGTSELATACAGLIKERAGKANNGLIGVWSSPNSQGAWELGLSPAADLASALKGKTVYVVAADPAGDDPRLNDALKSAKIVIAQDILATETTRLAGIVLPAAAYTEREGTYTSAERRVQRFYPAVPARAGTKPDFAITAELARLCGIELEGRSALLVMNRIAAGEKSFTGVTYNELSNVESQEIESIAGRSDIYYGGTSYKNTQGIGSHMVLASTSPELRDDQTQARVSLTFRVLRDIVKDGELVAVPVTRLYDMGTTVTPAALLKSHIGEASVALHPVTASKIGLLNDGHAVMKLNGVELEVKIQLDESISTGVVLVHRSFGFPISEPTAVELLAVQSSPGSSTEQRSKTISAAEKA